MGAPNVVNRIKGIPFFGFAGHYTTGNIFFVSSGHSNADDSPSHGSSPDMPFATIDYAVGRCTANNGDTIFVMPGHTETVSTAGGISLDVAGISVIGLGNGRNRPLITIGGVASAEIAVSAANILFKGFNLTTSVDSLENFFNVAANDFTIEDCLMYTSSSYQALCGINLNTTYDRLTVRRCTFNQPADPEGTDAAAGTGAIYMVDSEDILVEDCIFIGYWETAFFHNKTTACKNLIIKNCYGNCLLSTAQPYLLVAGATGADNANTTWLVPAATDVTTAALAGTLGNGFFCAARFGNDGDGDQGAVLLTAAT